MTRHQAQMHKVMGLLNQAIANTEQAIARYERAEAEVASLTAALEQAQLELDQALRAGAQADARAEQRLDDADTIRQELVRVMQARDAARAEAAALRERS